MAQKIEFLQADSTDALAIEFDGLAERLHALDTRITVAPVGFVVAEDGGYVLAVLIEVPYKNTLVGLGLDSITDTDAAE